MKSPLTIHLLTKDNANTILPCLDSLNQINCQLLVGDLGSRDNTLHICNSFKAKIIKLSLNDDISNARNHMIAASTTPWQMMIEPWEVLISGIDEIKKAIASQQSCYRFNIIENDIASKSSRLWHRNKNSKFENPIFSTLSGSAEDLPVFLSALPHGDALNIKGLAFKWHQRQPLLAEPTYYLSCMELTNKNWDSFLNYADLYLHREKKRPMSFYMTHYYMAMVYLLIKKDYQASLKHIVTCTIQHPTMAEFWCLLADIYYDLSDYKRAYELYENALLLGQRRKKDTEWPMEISKYKEYPEKMMSACNNLNKHAKVYVGKI